MRIRFGFTKYYPIQSPQGRLISGIFLALGILVLLAGVFLSWRYSRIEDELVSVQAVIERIDVTHRGDDTDHDVYVSYSYRGENYDNIRLNQYASSMDVGERITLQIHPDNPAEPVSNNGWILFFIGGIFTLLGGCLSVASRWDRLKDRFSRKEEYDLY
ncbi:MAG: DUF3592 domain-containing protein [Oscillospiraceae bacterium]|nr:DUF3592 domain-containing protein [Oscillospiraceae bacterium]